MPHTVIRVENLAKSYLIAHRQVNHYPTLKDALSGLAHSTLTKFPFRHGVKSGNFDKEEFWALKGVGFQVEHGERVGIIGRNGAGKSTLLKILSRITEPTKGRITINGRVASLLEVGTGFHPDLSGRENIFLNGAILGMSRAEIKQKFNEIVAFAEVEKFLDTPVKRYSSGMYVRLAFSVAAHLDPDILIVDEVLAVGDAEFQKKCLGKMRDVSMNEGRTVLFVSHDMDAIQRICTRCLLMAEGTIAGAGEPTGVVGKYLDNRTRLASPNTWIDLTKAARTGTGNPRFVSACYFNTNNAATNTAQSDGPIEFQLGVMTISSLSVGSIAVTLYDNFGTKLVNADSVALGQAVNLRPGHNLVRVQIERLHLTPGYYRVGLWMADPLAREPFDHVERAFELHVVDNASKGLGSPPQCDGVVSCSFAISTAG